jgi:hypothetical protein
VKEGRHTLRSSVSVDIFWMLSLTSAMSKEELASASGSVCTLLLVSLPFVCDPASVLAAIVWDSLDALSRDFDVCVCLA